MPNLVGIGNTQVPTNAMLGGLAYQDPAHANLTEVEIENIAAIKAKTNDTAVDIFVYDTRKDSDGGAWRKRTSNTSWYNEGVGQYRGARKEFPAVAILVASSSALTIYDADDPNCSMWMVFTSTNTTWLKHSTGSSPGPNSVVALNGNIVTCGYGDQGRLSVVNFISDDGYVTEPTYTYRHIWIATRNSTGVGGADANDTVNPRHIVNIYCLDLAITVLPDAPIDPDSGLPKPTIAVSTDGGVSVLKDDGTVVDIRRTSDDDVHHIAFDGDRVLMYMELGAIYVATIPSADQSGNPNAAWSVYGTYSANTSGTNYPKIISNGSGADLVSMKDHIFATSGQNDTGNDKHRGLSILSQNLSSSGNGMVAWIKSDFNSGWMHGNCKGAFLSDTDDTNINGTSLIANGDFSSSSTAAFTTVAGGTAAVVGGLLKLTDTGGAFCYASAPFTTVVGNQYYVTVDIVNSSNTAPSNYIRCGNAHNGTDFHDTNYGTSYGTKTFYFIATATTTYLTLISGHGAGNPFGHWDNVFVYKLDNDRSINNKGLRPVGTINKTAVATGAELVSYGGFSASNYFDFDSFNFGTGDFSVSVWAIPSTDTTNEFILELDDASQGSNRFYLLVTNTATKKLYVPWDSDIAGSELVAGVWNHIVVGRRSGVGYVYVNGKSIADGTDAWTTSLNGNGRGTIGNYSATPNAGYAWSGKLALLRISGSMPTTDQVKKIYNDEKHFFQENAKCTLYGSSNAVTAVAYDDSNDILHAGTSAGRSEFNGLARINNTTTAVTTAISVSDGLVAEQ